MGTRRHPRLTPRGFRVPFAEPVRLSLRIGLSICDGEGWWLEPSQLELLHRSASELQGSEVTVLPMKAAMAAEMPAIAPTQLFHRRGRMLLPDPPIDRPPHVVIDAAKDVLRSPTPPESVFYSRRERIEARAEREEPTKTYLSYVRRHRSAHLRSRRRRADCAEGAIEANRFRAAGCRTCSEHWAHLAKACQARTPSAAIWTRSSPRRRVMEPGGPPEDFPV